MIGFYVINLQLIGSETQQVVSSTDVCQYFKIFICFKLGKLKRDPIS